MSLKTLKIFLLMMFVVPAFAQDDQKDNDDIQQLDPKAEQKIKAAHAAYITERLDLTPEEAEKFWPVYREYSQKRRDLRKQFKEAKAKGEDEKKLLDLDLKIKQQELDLEKDYSAKLQKVITPQKLINLRQAEGDFRRLLLKQIQQRQHRKEQMRDRSQRQQQRNN